MFKNEGKAVVKYPMDGQAVDVAGRSFHHGAGREGGGGAVIVFTIQLVGVR